MNEATEHYLHQKRVEELRAAKNAHIADLMGVIIHQQEIIAKLANTVAGFLPPTSDEAPPCPSEKPLSSP